MQHGCNKKFFLFLQSSCIKETLALVQELLPTIMEISNASKGGAPEILQDIQLSNKNIVCFERDISHLQSELAELSEREIEFSHSGRPSEIVTALKSYFGTRCLQLHSLVADIIFLLTLFDKIASSGSYRISLVTVSTDMCRRFHCDMNQLRLLCTYVGEGTLWVPDEAVNRAALQALEDDSKIVSDKNMIQQASNGEVLILKGALYGGKGTKAIVHKSPEIERKKEQRLVLRIDSNDLFSFE
jgi:hypothetical protein